MRARVRAARHEEGFALLGVLLSMTVLSLFLLASLGFALNSMKPSRRDQDAKAALAAAQAGIDEYVARLNANDTYWSTVDCTNLAVVPRPASCSGAPTTGVAVPGTTGAATYRYRLLTSTSDTTSTGVIQLAVTGSSRGTTRDLVAELNPAGFLRYIYFTDKEVVDPAIDTANPWATLNGLSQSVDSAGSTHYYRASQDKADELCTRYWYTGRSAPVYTSGSYLETVVDTSNRATTTQRQADAAHTVAFTCQEIRFTSGDRIAGKLKTNDAMLLDGSPFFTSPSTETAWAAAPDPARPWRGTGVPSAGTTAEPGYPPVYAAALQMPDSNAELRTAAATAGTGCVYSGVTRIIFLDNGRMRVTSPGTTASTSCGGGSSASTDVNVPSVVYVEDLPSSRTCTNQLGYPAAGEDVSGRITTDYSCRKGNAYLSGVVKGRVTVASSNDIVVVGDTTYKDGLSGTDALGLIPQNYAWVYHPVRADGSNLLTTPVRNLDAAVLSVNHSFLVQNWSVGAALSSSSTASTKLHVRGAIAQRYRGPVGAGAEPSMSGYLKDYQYDTRLNNAPPPYFLKPLNSPYVVSKVSD